jgi:hypothetical protein
MEPGPGYCEWANITPLKTGLKNIINKIIKFIVIPQGAKSFADIGEPNTKIDVIASHSKS